MPNLPTADQLESRKQLADFIRAANEKIRSVSGTVSEWFGRPSDELKGWIERGRALAEIEGSMGYRLISATLEKEILHSQQALEICAENQVQDWRMYLKSLRFIQSFILTTRRDADIASGVLAGREGSIGRDSATFVKNARVDN
jgi:hypothetical protein